MMSRLRMEAAVWLACLLSAVVCVQADDPIREPAEATEPGFFGFFFDIDEQGVKVTRLHPGGPAETAGLKVEDHVVTIDGTALQGMSHVDFHELLSRYYAGSRASLSVLRGGRLMTFEIALTAKPEEFRMPPEDLVRHRRRLEEHEAIEAVLRLVRRSEILLIRRAADGETLVRPVIEDAPWTVTSPALASILDSASRGALSDLEPGGTLEVKAILGDNSLELRVLHRSGDS